ncbi:hypothetical protein [Rhodococcus sp. WAY2]|uniref:hypothetical protein n=1 Tax=Rhodococcus sp. WAY2 TaxID=2663121 RepID=UPI00135B8452|nr:hypothetical protein [Rhodococcus sp. WAY2]
MKHALVAYEVSLSELRKPKITLPLDNFDGRGASLIRLFATYVNSMPKGRLVKKDSRHFGMPHDVETAGYTYRCKIVSGTSGIFSVIKKPGDSGPGYMRTAQDIEQINFAVYFVQPPDAHVGFLLVETVAGRSVGQAFRTIFINLFRAQYPEVMITMGRTAEVDAWKEAEKAGQAVSVKSITAIHRGIDASAMQMFGIGGTSRKLGEYHRVLRFKENPESSVILKKMREHFFPPSNALPVADGTVALSDGDDGGPDEDEASELVAEVSYPGRRSQTIRVSGARPPLITYPVNPVGAEDTDAAFKRASKAVVKSLVEQTDCKLPPKWEDRAWDDAENLPVWEVTEFAQDPDRAT